jgi:hypothetical protein
MAATTTALDSGAWLSHHDPLLDDVKARYDRLDDDRKQRRLFSDAVSIDVLDVGAAGAETKTYTDNAAFESECLQQQPVGSRYYMLKPSMPHCVSRCQLHVTEDVTQKLIAAHKIMPSFLDHLQAYGRRATREQDASFGGGRFKLGFSADQVNEYELCYTVKFAFNTGRKDEKNIRAYSIRQTSVYQKFKFDVAKSVWILVQPSDSMQKRTTTSATRVEGNPLKTHLVFASASTEGWRDYYNLLEKIFYETVSCPWLVQKPDMTDKTLDKSGSELLISQRQ